MHITISFMGEMIVYENGRLLLFINESWKEYDIDKILYNEHTGLIVNLRSPNTRLIISNTEPETVIINSSEESQKIMIKIMRGIEKLITWINKKCGRYKEIKVKMRIVSRHFQYEVLTQEEEIRVQRMTRNGEVTMNRRVIELINGQEGMLCVMDKNYFYDSDNPIVTELEIIGIN